MGIVAGRRRPVLFLHQQRRGARRSAARAIFFANPYYRSTASQNVALMDSQEVWPSHPTPGVNRGYTKDQLREDGTLRTATAAGGGAIYRGDLLPAEFSGNLFTPEPSGNLIKRMLVTDVGGKLSATNAYEGKDFLTSTDERFRPVQICTGPDGALYVVDMYHGILQHRYFLTHYLVKNIARRKLDTPIHWGRIYRIVPDRSARTPVVLAPPDRRQRGARGLRQNQLSRPNATADQEDRSASVRSPWNGSNSLLIPMAGFATPPSACSSSGPTRKPSPP